MSKKKKNKHISKKELIFNVISLVIAICIGIYFGVRSFYYYGRQSTKIKEEAMTLNGVVLSSNEVLKDGDGLHQDTTGYYFKGNVLNNYVMFANRLFRVMQVNNDGTVKLISNDIVSEFMWGENSSYKDSNLYQWLSVNDVEGSGIYYNTIPNPKKFLVKTEYSEDRLLDSNVEDSKVKYKDYVTTLSIKDYSKVNGKNSYLNIGKYFWILGLDKEKNNLCVDSEGVVDSAIGYDGYGIRPVITLKKNLKITGGDGTGNNPYVIDQGNDINYVDQYVKLGEHNYKIIEDNNGVLRMALNGYITDNTDEYLSSYSMSTSLFDITNRKNIGYYLNNTFYHGLSYADILSDCNFYTGEVSNETGFKYTNIYSDVVTAKVGLINLFDYNSNTQLDNYYFMNTTSSVGSMGYVYHNTGLLEDDKVTEKRHVVPVVCINKNLVKAGTGSVENPFVVG